MDLSPLSWAMLVAVTGFGAVAQSAIGFGFALMTVPFYLLLLEVRDAVQLAMILTLAITVTMVMRIYQDIPRETAKNLVIGSVAGFPLGLVFFLYASSDLIKAVVAITILIALGTTALKSQRAAALTDNRANGIVAGLFSGAMVTSIAMAGPAIAIYMQAVAAGKIKTRATIFCIFLFSYPCAIVMQLGFYGIGTTGLKAAMWLLPVTLLGTYIGHRISGLLSEKLFSRIISGILIFIALYLLYSVY